MRRFLVLGLGLALLPWTPSEAFRARAPRAGRALAGRGAPLSAAPSEEDGEAEQAFSPLAALSNMAEEAEKTTARWVQEQADAVEEASEPTGLGPPAEAEEGDVRVAYGAEMTPPVLRESDLYNSEWRIGIVWKPRGLAKILPPRYAVEETWLRLGVDAEKGGEQVAVWGTGRQGDWAYREDAKTLTASMEAPVLDFFGSATFQPDWLSRYYMMGWVRGWTLFESVELWGIFEAERIDRKGAEGKDGFEAPWTRFKDMDEEQARMLVRKELEDLDDQSNWFLDDE